MTETLDCDIPPPTPSVRMTETRLDKENTPGSYNHFLNDNIDDIINTNESQVEEEILPIDVLVTKKPTKKELNKHRHKRNMSLHHGLQVS